MAIFNWKAGVNADWNTLTAWDLGIVPNSSLATDAVINAAGNTVTIGAAESIAVSTVTLDAGTLNVQPTGKLSAAGGVFVGGGSLGPAGGAASLVVSGTLIDNGALDVWAGSTLTVT